MKKYVFKHETAKMQPLMALAQPEVSGILTRELGLFFNNLQSADEVVQAVNQCFSPRQGEAVA